jgi:hypothetical protein
MGDSEQERQREEREKDDRKVWREGRKLRDRKKWRRKVIHLFIFIPLLLGTWSTPGAFIHSFIHSFVRYC